MNRSGALSISPWENGQSSIVSDRPTNASGRPRSRQLVGAIEPPLNAGRNVTEEVMHDCALAGLARAVDNDHPRITQGVRDRRFHVSSSITCHIEDPTQAQTICRTQTSGLPNSTQPICQGLANPGHACGYPPQVGRTANRREVRQLVLRPARVASAWDPDQP